jgi:hypothetical protein
MKKSIQKYNLNAISCDLKEFDYLAKDGDFVEVCEWKNGEGYDVTINEKQHSFTHGELEAINYLIAQLNNE